MAEIVRPVVQPVTFPLAGDLRDPLGGANVPAVLTDDAGAIYTLNSDGLYVKTGGSLWILGIDSDGAIVRDIDGAYGLEAY